MSYEHPRTEIYQQPSSAFGATTESAQYRGPKGMKGQVRDICVYLTAAAVGTTTVPEIAVGTAAGLSEYARFRLGTTAIAGYATFPAPYRASVIAGDSQYGFSLLEDFAGHVKMSAAYTPAAYIPADAIFFISRVAGTGGSPAGTGSSFVIVDWF